MAFAWWFPGQGSQEVGMGKALAESSPAARDVFARVDEALGEPLSKMCFEGPIEDLTLTYNKVRQANITREMIEIATGAATA